MKKQYTFIDLFAGIGGMRLGFERAGAKCVWANDVDKHCVKTYIANFGDEHIVCEDIRKIDSSEIPDFDILCGGFPCQPFSPILSHKNRLSGFKTDKGFLYKEIVRILKDKKPKAYLLENVPGLLRMQKGQIFKIIKKEIEDAGYSVFYEIIDSSSLVPQKRLRVFIVGFKDKNIEFQFPKFENKELKFKDFKEKNPSKEYMLSEKSWNYLLRHKIEQAKKGNTFGYRIIDINKPAPTLVGSTDGREALIQEPGWERPRRYTITECKRLMGFPEDFKFPVSKTRIYKQLGNAVVVPVVEAIAKEIIKTLEKYY